jgi:signal transduction histidine kinase
VKFIESVANIIGVAIERSQEGERLGAAREGERARIARELHDDGLRELTEALGAVSLARATATDERDEQRWAATAVSLQRLGRELRSAIYNLRLGTHEDRAFVDLLDELVAVQAELTANGHVRLTGRERLPLGSLGGRGTELLRIVREAITNARRHADATLIRVEAGGSTRERLRIAVSDDGQWSDRARVVATRRGTGILGMFERADAIGATLRIQGRTTGGTTVSLELPLRARSDERPRRGHVAN